MVVEVDVENPALTLSPGMYAQTEITLQQRSAALTIPAEAVVHGENGDYVLAVDNSQVVKKNVTLGIQGPDKVEILSGLAEGETVILSGQTNYQAGEKVRPQASSVTAPEGSR
jgi:RND family efflux transporter MFP subunit